MAIRIIQETERLVFDCSGEAKIFYKRIPRYMYSKWVREFTTRRGDRTDWNAVGRAAMEYAILDWEGFEDETGPVKYTPDKIDNIPGAVVDEFTTTLMDGFVPKDQETARKNS
jgi:hypothetical protein